MTDLYIKPFGISEKVLKIFRLEEAQFFTNLQPSQHPFDLSFGGIRGLKVRCWGESTWGRKEKGIGGYKQRTRAGHSHSRQRKRSWQGIKLRKSVRKCVCLFQKTPHRSEVSQVFPSIKRICCQHVSVIVWFLVNNFVITRPIDTKFKILFNSVYYLQSVFTRVTQTCYILIMPASVEMS